MSENFVKAIRYVEHVPCCHPPIPPLQKKKVPESQALIFQESRMWCCCKCQWRLMRHLGKGEHNWSLPAKHLSWNCNFQSCHKGHHVNEYSKQVQALMRVSSDWGDQMGVRSWNHNKCLEIGIPGSHLWGHCSNQSRWSSRSLEVTASVKSPGYELFVWSDIFLNADENTS